jgi:pimeloyl-ACP methyl ester carboxylesterase
LGTANILGRLRGWFSRRADGESILDQRILSERLFFPNRHEVPGAFFVECPGARLACRRLVRSLGAGTLLHFHGNGECASDYADGDFGEMLSEIGVNACFAEYRGYGGSSGSPSLVKMLDDGEQIVRALGVPPGRLVVYGRSLGSIYAIELARRVPGVAGLILESGIADVLERLRLRVTPGDLKTTEAGLAREVSRRFDHRAKLRAYRGPLLILHARHDHLIHYSHAQRLHDWGAGTDKTLVIFPEGDHNSLIAANSTDFFASMGGFLRGLGMDAS